LVVFDLGFATSATDPGFPPSVRWSVRIERQPPATEVPRQRLVEASLTSDSAMDRGIGKRCRSCSWPIQRNMAEALIFWAPNEFENVRRAPVPRFAVAMVVSAYRHIFVDAALWTRRGGRAKARDALPHLLPAPARRCPDSRFAFRQASNLSARDLAESEAGALAKGASRTTTIPQVMPATEAIEVRKRTFRSRSDEIELDREPSSGVSA
jgi:hypothetical protein